MNSDTICITISINCSKRSAIRMRTDRRQGKIRIYLRNDCTRINSISMIQTDMRAHARNTIWSIEIVAIATIICDCKCCKAERPRYNRITSICIREVSGKKKRATQRVLIVYKLEAAFWGTHKTNRIGYMDVRFKSNCRCICTTS